MPRRDDAPVSHSTIRRLTAEIRVGDASYAVDQLALVLPPHFAYEERPDGFFQRMVELGHSAEMADRLMEDHADLLAELTLLLDGERDAAWQERAKTFAEHLSRHEFEEARYAASSPLLSGDHDTARRWGL